MKLMLYPICCAHMLSQSDEKLVFRTFSNQIYKFSSNIELILAILEKSTGMFPSDVIAQAVSRKMGIPLTVVKDAIDDLITCKILVNSYEQISLYHRLTYNPPQYPAVISLDEIDELTAVRPDYTAKSPVAVYTDQAPLTPPVCKSLADRHSCRAFQDIPVEIKKLFALCRVSYSCRLSPVASAGGLFPLSIYFINRYSSELPAGIYQYDPKKEILLLLTTDLIPEALRYALNDEDMIFDAPCIFFVCGDIGRHIKKYANRGYRYTLLEAGHAIQNMTLAAAELGLGGIEYGGFCDEAVKRLLQLPEEVFPLACYAAGYEDSEKNKIERLRQKERERRILEQISRSKELALNPRLVDDDRLKLSNLRVMVSLFKDAAGHMEFGTGAAAAYSSAYVGSVMEAYERYTLSRRYSDFMERADRLDGPYLDPEEYAPYSDTQLLAAGFSRFRKEASTEWLRGYGLDGDPVYIPADLCFDAASPERTPCHIANTSGCAANFDVASAERAALLELIERDAIVRIWLYRQTPWQLCEDSLSGNIRQRFKRYKEQGVSLFVLLLPCEYAYAVLVCSTSASSPPYFVSGAAASFASASEAAAKAFNEWEISFVLGGSRPAQNIIKPDKVISPADHGNLYRWTNYNDKIDYLLHGPKIRVHAAQANRLRNIRELSPVFCLYRTLVDHAYVVRAFSKELVPINFGYGMDFWRHHKIDKCLLKQHEFPHFFS